MHHIFRPTEWKQYYDIDVDAPPFDDAWLSEPCPFEGDKTLGDTHYIFFGPQMLDEQPLTIMRWHELSQAPGHPKIFESEHGWWNELSCATEATCNGAWYAIYAGLVSGSDLQIPYIEGVVDARFMPEGYRVPTGVELVTAHLTHFNAFGAPMLTNKWAWSSDNAGMEHHMIVGHYQRDERRGPNMLRINLNWKREERGSTGFQPIRKLS